MWPVVLMYVLLIPCVACYLHMKWTGGAALTVALKAFCTGIILVTAALGLDAVPAGMRLDAALIVAGLAFGLAGDVAIGRKVEYGMLCFGLGHGCYIAAMYRLSDCAACAVPIFAVLYGLLTVLYVINRRRLPMGRYLLPGIVYAALLLGMASIALTLPGSIGLAGVAFCAGALLFVISDTMLSITISAGDAARQPHTPHRAHLPSPKRRRDILWDSVCLYCYFLGQSLFALGIFLLKTI